MYSLGVPGANCVAAGPIKGMNMPVKARKDLTDLTLKFNGIPVSFSQRVNNLGVTMDSDLSSEYHIKNVTKIAFFPSL